MDRDASVSQGAGDDENEDEVSARKCQRENVGESF